MYTSILAFFFLDFSSFPTIIRLKYAFFFQKANFFPQMGNFSHLLHFTLYRWLFGSTKTGHFGTFFNFFGLDSSTKILSKILDCTQRLMREVQCRSALYLAFSVKVIYVNLTSPPPPKSFFRISYFLVKSKNQSGSIH